MQAYGILVRTALRRHWRTLGIQSLAIWLAISLIGAGALAISSVESSLQQTARVLNAPQLWVSYRAADLATPYEQIVRQPNIASASPLVPQLNGWLQTASSTIPAIIMPLTPDSPLRHLQLQAGTWPTREQSGLALENGAAQYLGLSPGQDIGLLGPHGAENYPLRATVRDLSQGTYPFSAPALVYVDGLTWTTLSGTTAATSARFGVRLIDPGQVQTTVNAMSAVLPQGSSSIVSWRWVADGLAPLLQAVTGFIIVFGGFALIAALIFTLGSTGAELLRRSQEIGMLQATGWSVRQIRRVFIIQNLLMVLPGIGLGCISALVLGQIVTNAIVKPLGITATLGNPWLILVMIVLGCIGMIWGATRSIVRWIGQIAPAAALTGGYQRTPSRLTASLQQGWMPLPLRIALAFVWSRPLYALVNMAVIGISLIAIVFAVVLNATVVKFSTDPSTWGYAYDWQVRAPQANQSPMIAATLQAMPEFARVEPVAVRNAFLVTSKLNVMIKFIQPDQQLLALNLLEGGLPRQTNDILVGAGLAQSLKLAVGADLDMVVQEQPQRGRVVGIYREFENLGQVIIAPMAVLTTVDAQAQPAYFIVRLKANTDQVAVRQRLEQTTPQPIITDVRAALDIPFVALLQRILLAFGSGLLALSGIIMFNILLLLTQQSSYAFGIIKALGASRRQLSGVGSYMFLILLLPCLLIAVPLGILLATSAIHRLSTVIGGVDAVIPLWQLASVLPLALLTPLLGFLLPMRTIFRQSSWRAIQSQR